MRRETIETERESGGRSESCHVALELMGERREERGQPAKNIQLRWKNAFFCVLSLCVRIYFLIICQIDVRILHNIAVHDRGQWPPYSVF